MEKSQMKNIVVLRNLPSNLIEEAFVIVKSKKTANSLEYIDKRNNINKKENKQKDYIIREAESVISSYINTMEKKNSQVKKSIDIKKYKALKAYSIVATICLFISVLLII